MILKKFFANRFVGGLCFFCCMLWYKGWGKGWASGAHPLDPPLGAAATLGFHPNSLRSPDDFSIHIHPNSIQYKHWYTATKIVKFLLLNLFTHGGFWKHPLFPGFAVEVQLVKTTCKLENWLSLTGSVWSSHWVWGYKSSAVN